MAHHQTQNYLQMINTSLFSVFHDVDIFANELNNDLHQINRWSFQWKMGCNPDQSKQAEEIIFIKNTKKKSLILCFVLIIVLSHNPHIKNTSAYFLMLN